MTVLASPTLQAGWNTFGLVFAAGEVPAGYAVQLGGLPTQTDVLRTHDDGSARHVAVTANVLTPGAYPVTAVPTPAGGTFAPTVPAVTLTLANACWAVASATGNGQYTSGTTCSFSWAPTATAAITLYSGGGYITGLTFTSPGTDPAGTGPVTFGNVGAGAGASYTAWTNDTLTATVPAAVPGSGFWLNGPLVKCWRQEGFFTSALLGGPHPVAKYLVDFYCYSDGTAWADVAVEWSYDRPENVPTTYNATVQVNGSTVFTGPSNVVHYPGQRWMKGFGAGQARAPWYGVAGGYDWAGAVRAGAVPQTDGRLASITYTPGSDSGWGILPSNVAVGGGGGHVLGDLDQADFTTGGAHTYLYAWPAWAVQCLGYPGDATSWDYLLRMGEQWGGFPCHLRNRDGTYALDGRGNGVPNAGDPTRYLVHSNSSTVANQNWNGPGPGYNMDAAHVVNWAQLPYLVTARRHFADELKYNASFVPFTQDPNAESAPVYTGLSGTLTRANGYGLGVMAQVRSVAWALRTLAHSAWLCPDSDAEWKPFVTSLLTASLATADGYEAGSYGPTRFQGAGFPAWWGLGNPGIPAYWWSIKWQENYIAWMLDHLHGLGYTGGENKVLDQARFQVALLTSADFDSRFACLLNDVQGTVSGGVYTPYTTLAQLNAYYAANPPNGNEWLVNSTFKTDARLMCLVLLRRGNAADQANAQAALSLLEANGVNTMAFSTFPQFGIAEHYWGDPLGQQPVAAAPAAAAPRLPQAFVDEDTVEAIRALWAAAP